MLMDDLRNFTVSILLAYANNNSNLVKKVGIGERKSGPDRIKTQTVGKQGSRTAFMFNLKRCQIWTDINDRVQQKSSTRFVTCWFSESWSTSDGSTYAYTSDGKSVSRRKKGPFLCARSDWRNNCIIKLNESTLSVTMSSDAASDILSASTSMIILTDGSSNCEAMLVMDFRSETPELILMSGKREYMNRISYRSYSFSLPYAVCAMFNAAAIWDWIEPWGNTHISRRIFRGLLQMWNNLSMFSPAGRDKWLKCQGSYRHWALPKNNKKGYRLISAPRGELRRRAEGVHNEIIKLIKLNDMLGPGTLSYLPEVDYVRELSTRYLSIESAGRYCLQIDLKDFFTNINPKILFQCIGGNVELISALAPLLGFTKIFKRGYPLRRRPLPEDIFTELFGLATTVLPLWKRELGGYNLETGEEEEQGCQKSIRKFAEAVFKKDNFQQIAALHKKVSPYIPMSQRGIPQGAAFSGDMANLVADELADGIVHWLKHLQKDLRIPVNVTKIVYSDNIYLFYDAPTNILNIARREIPQLFLKEYRKLLVPWKILNFDRTISDVKLLGIIIDKDGSVRLSRMYRRKINQAIIHAAKGSAWNSQNEGQKQWYLHVRKYMTGNYSRKLIGENDKEER